MNPEITLVQAWGRERPAANNLLIAQYIEGGLQLAARVRIAGDGQAPAIKVPRLIQAAEFFAGLAAMIVSRGVRGILPQNRLEFRNRVFQLALLDVRHRQPVTGKRTGWIVGDQLPQLFDTGVCQTVSG